MKVRVKLYATLAGRVASARPGKPFEVELPPAADVEALLERLELPGDLVRTVFVNGRSRPMDWSLSDGDEVGLFPPVGGG